MRRVFQLDVLRCDRCGVRREVIARVPFETTHRVVSIPLRGTAAYLTDALVARRILEHLGLAGEPPQPSAARAPPQGVFGF